MFGGLNTRLRVPVLHQDSQVHKLQLTTSHFPSQNSTIMQLEFFTWNL
jgi:hypothetical protein